MGAKKNHVKLQATRCGFWSGDEGEGINYLTMKPEVRGRRIDTTAGRLAPWIQEPNGKKGGHGWTCAGCTSIGKGISGGDVVCLAMDQHPAELCWTVGFGVN